MKNYKLYILFTFIMFYNMNAQSGIKLTDYYFNPIQYNPAYAGSVNGFFTKATYTSQWLGFDDGPNTQTLDAQMRFSGGKYAAGISLLNDDFGAVRNFNLETNFALHLRAYEDLGFVLGLKAGLNNFSIDYNRLNIFDPTEFVYSSGNLVELNPIIGAGFYVFSDKWFFGMSVPNFLSQRLEDELNRDIYNKIPHFYSSAGYDFKLSDDILLKSQLLMQVVKGAPVSYLLTNKFMYKEKLGLGLHFQANALYGAFSNFKLKNGLAITYGYDMALSDLSEYSNGNHYFGLSYLIHKSSDCCDEDLDFQKRVYIVE